MVDFKKKIASKSGGDKVDPIEIYASLDRASDKGLLRPSQEAILTNWFTLHNDKKDVIIKLHTGQGKTLIGLLILQSKLNQKKGPVMFVCPNIQLVEQTCEEARQFGIKFCKAEEIGDLPTDFLEGKSILIIHVQKVFNGLTKFGLGNRAIDVGALVLDDSHACIDHIESTVSIKIPNTDDSYFKILELFEEDLKFQGTAKYEEIIEGIYDVILPVPHWAWKEKFHEAIKIVLKSKEKNYVKYSWPLLKEEFDKCRCIVSAQHIEITPYRIPIEHFKFYKDASCRIFMSATTNNDSFFIKGLGIDKSTVANPLTFAQEKWSGEKMILIPFEISHELNRQTIVSGFAKANNKRKYGVVGLTPSERATKLWEANGALVVNAKNIQSSINLLKGKNYEKTLVFANRYDGIDLPDSMCRILIIDSRPYSHSLFDQYQEKCRTESDLIDIKIAQKIEQGLGRGVRGEKDYCVIVIATYDIMTTTRNRKLKRYFSAQTNKQIEIGVDIAKSASEEADTDNSWDVLVGLINQALRRDEGWKEFYTEEMDSIVDQANDNSILENLYLEKKAEDQYLNEQYNEAVKTLQTLIDKFISQENKDERGWYMQEMSRLIYPINKTESNKFQISAHKNNRALLRPQTGMEVQKLEMNGSRIQNIKDHISSFENYNELKLHVVRIFSDFAFGTLADKCENAVFELGRLLGFGSERPDNDWKAGPDNLWNIRKGEYILIECKNEVFDTREEINKAETGQMNNACAWFRNNYASEKKTNVMVISTKNISAATGFNEDVVILRKGGLNKLRKNVFAFIDELKGFDITNLSDSQLHSAIKSNKLLEDDILSDYFEEPFQKKK